MLSEQNLPQLFGNLLLLAASTAIAAATTTTTTATTTAIDIMQFLGLCLLVFPCSLVA